MRLEQEGERSGHQETNQHCSQQGGPIKAGDSGRAGEWHR